MTKLAFAVFAISLGAAHGALCQQLNKLDNCADMASMLQDTYHDPKVCSRPSGAIARGLAARMPNSELCFFRPRQTALTDFQCVQSQGVGSISCFREQDKPFIDNYKEKYESEYAEQSSAYMKAAAACSFSNGFATPAPSTVLSFTPLEWVARSELAFGVEGGPRSKPTTSVMHGFARTDPTLSDAPRWIEFVIANTGGCRRSDCITPSSNSEVTLDRNADFEVYYDRDEERRVEGAVRQMAAQRGLPISLDLRAFEIRATSAGTPALRNLDDLKTVGPENTTDPASRWIDKWMRNSQQALFARGYHPFDDDDAASLGMSRDQVLNVIKSNMSSARAANNHPYGRGSFPATNAEVDVDLFVKSPVEGGCVRGGENEAIFLVLRSTSGVILGGLAAGSCGSEVEQDVTQIGKVMRLR